MVGLLTVGPSCPAVDLNVIPRAVFVALVPVYVFEHVVLRPLLATYVAFDHGFSYHARLCRVMSGWM
jgi:hypothetical protein